MLYLGIQYFTIVRVHITIILGSKSLHKITSKILEDKPSVESGVKVMMLQFICGDHDYIVLLLRSHRDPNRF
jgi:hypothetical protein